FYRNVKATAESGLDFSSRWMRDPKDLRTLETTELIPVDLNSLLYHAERMIAALRAFRGRAGDAEVAKQFTRAAEDRRQALLVAAYDSASGFFYDVRWRSGERVTDRPTLAAASPLDFGLATAEQGRAGAGRGRGVPDAGRVRVDERGGPGAAKRPDPTGLTPGSPSRCRDLTAGGEDWRGT